MAEAISTTQPPQTAEKRTRPYAPSWVDRLTAWVERLPGPSWAYYAGGWLILFLLYTAIKWRDGTYPVGTFFPYHMLLPLYPFYYLALIHYLDRVAQAALLTFRPALNVSPAEFDDLRYRLTTLPAGRTLVFSILTGLVIIGLGLAGRPMFQAIGVAAKLDTSVEAALLEQFTLFFVSMAAAAVLYHTLRQLRLVNDIYTRYTQVSLFRLHPLYAFSGLTARTAVGLLLVVYMNVAVLPEVLSETATVVLAMSLITVAVVTFALPLMGIHRLLVEEKARLESENGQLIEATLAELHRRVRAQELGEIDTLNNALASLLAGEAKLASIPTWPWEPETVRGLATALAFPVVLWLMTRILERVLGP